MFLHPPERQGMTDATASIPKLVTCSYAAYRRDMGTAVRITLSPPRYITLPDPRYSRYAKSPYLPELAPKADYFRAPQARFDAQDLDHPRRLTAHIPPTLPPTH